MSQCSYPILNPTTSAACSRAGEWSHALKLFVNMKTDRIRCDVVAYNALMSAFANGGKADMVSMSFDIVISHFMLYIKAYNINSVLYIME